MSISERAGSTDQLKSIIDNLEDKVFKFILSHSNISNENSAQLLSGSFNLYRGRTEYDLYGSVDAAYSLYALSRLTTKTNQNSRNAWARRILSCQDPEGWFSELNNRGHSNEHATAYAIGALKLLAIDQDEEYLSQLRPINAILPLLSDYEVFINWIEKLDFRLDPGSILNKKLGWHYIWRGSHVGGGIPAIIGMSRDQIEKWWPDVDVFKWFKWYFDWLDQKADASSGFWQLALWNIFYKKPTIIDMGGATHYFWIYEALNRPFPYPERVLQSTIVLQKESGLYRGHPYCIDLDANFCIIRSFLQLPEDKQDIYRPKVNEAIESNFIAVVNALTERPIEDIYDDSHGLPGALAALVECKKLPGFRYADLVTDWNNPLDRSWWL